LMNYYSQHEMYVPKKAEKSADGKEEGSGKDDGKEGKDGKDAKDGGNGDGGDGDSKNDNEDHIPKFIGAHIAVTAATEVLCKMILEETIKQLQKETSGLYNISRPAIKFAVMFNDDLRFLLTKSLQSFDKNMMYVDQFCIPHKEMTQYIDSVFGKNIMLDKKAYNLLAYLLLKFVMDIASHAYHMISFAEKRCLNYNVVKYAVMNLCSGTLEHNMVLKIEDAYKLCDVENKKKTEENKKKNKDKEAQGGKPGDGGAGDKGKPEPEPVDSEDNDEGGDGDGGDDGNDEAENEPPKPAPAPPKKTGPGSKPKAN